MLFAPRLNLSCFPSNMKSKSLLMLPNTRTTPDRTTASMTRSEGKVSTSSLEVQQSLTTQMPKLVSRKTLLKSCRVCRKLQKDRTIWTFINPETTQAWAKFLRHLRRSHSEGVERKELRTYQPREAVKEQVTHMESVISEFLAAIRDGTSERDECKALYHAETLLREKELHESWEHEVSKLLHEYEVHDVPHREITGRDNYFGSISEISRFTNPQFTKQTKAIVKGRARFRCECCGRSWTDVTHPDDETLYFKTLEALWNKQFDDQAGFKLPDLASTTFVEYSEANTSSICKNCGARLQIFTAWWSNEPKPIRPSTWFQVHHKNFQHFDNRLENLEYLCGNCHGAKGQWDTTNKRVSNWHHGMKYV